MSLIDSLLCLTCLHSFIKIGEPVQEISLHKETSKSTSQNLDLISVFFMETVEILILYYNVFPQARMEKSVTMRARNPNATVWIGSVIAMTRTIT